MVERTQLAKDKPLGFVLNLSGARIPHADLSHANLERANFARADCRFVDFTGANMDRAILKGTKLQGAILQNVKNLTWAQLREAHIDDSTILPDYLAAAVREAPP